MAKEMGQARKTIITGCHEVKCTKGAFNASDLAREEMQPSESPSTLKRLMDEFNDLTKMMTCLKYSLKDFGSNAETRPKPKNCKSTSANETSIITDVTGAKKVILECIAELSVIKNFLDGNEEKAEEFREKLWESITQGCCTESEPHIHVRIKNNPILVTLDSTTRTKLGLSNSSRPSEVMMDVCTMTPSSSLAVSQKEVACETIVPLTVDSAMSPVQSATQFNVSNDGEKSPSKEEKNSSKPKWYELFTVCARSSSKTKSEYSESKTIDDPPAEEIRPAEIVNYVEEITSRKRRSQELHRPVKNVEYSQVECREKYSTHAPVIVQGPEDVSKCPSRGKFRKETPVERQRSSSGPDAENYLRHYYGEEKKNGKPSRVFHAYNALVNRGANDFAKFYAGWSSQPDLEASIRPFYPERSSNSRLEHRTTENPAEAKKAKSISFLRSSKSHGSYVVCDPKKEKTKETLRYKDKRDHKLEENLLRDIHRCLRYYLRHQNYSCDPERPKPGAKSESKKPLEISPYKKQSPSKKGKRTFRFTVNKQAVGVCDLAEQEGQENGSIRNDVSERVIEPCRKIGQTDAHVHTWSSMKLQDQRRLAEKLLHFKEIGNNGKDFSRKSERRTKEIRSTTICGQYLNTGWTRRQRTTVEGRISTTTFDAPALPNGSFYSEAVTRVSRAESRVSKSGTHEDKIGNSKASLRSGYSSFSRRLSTNDRVTIEENVTYQRKDDYDKRNNQWKQCDKLTQRADKIVWALARVNVFDDGYRSCDILETTPVPPGKKINIKRINAFRLGQTCHCKRAC